MGTHQRARLRAARDQDTKNLLLGRDNGDGQAPAVEEDGVNYPAVAVAVLLAVFAWRLVDNGLIACMQKDAKLGDGPAEYVPACFQLSLFIVVAELAVGVLPILAKFNELTGATGTAAP